MQKTKEEIETIPSEWMIELPGYLCSGVCPRFLKPVFYANDTWEVYLYWKKISLFWDANDIINSVTHDWVSNWIIKILLSDSYYIDENDAYYNRHWEKYTFTDEYIDKIDKAVKSKLVPMFTQEELTLTLDAMIRKTWWYWYWDKNDVIIWTFYRHIRNRIWNFY